MEKVIGYHKESSNKFFCNNCFQAEAIKDGYIQIKEDNLKESIYTCDKCGKKFGASEPWETSPDETKEKTEKTRISVLWYFLPILFGFFGGLIGWALLRDQNKEKAVQLLTIGIAVTGIAILLKILIK